MTSLQPAFKAASKRRRSSRRRTPADKRRKMTTRDCPRVMVRFSEDDYARLQELADGMALSTFIRAKALSKTSSRAAFNANHPTPDKQALAQILGLLGQSRIANNLNQLAHHANIGSLFVDDPTRAEINEAYQHVLFLRQTLLEALGRK